MNKIAIVVTSFTGGANPELKEKMTKTLCKKLSSTTSYYICLASHSPIDAETQQYCNAAIYDSDNSFQIDGLPKDKLTHGMAELKSLHNAINHLQGKGFTHMFKLTFDCDPTLDFNTIIEKAKIVIDQTGKKMICSGWGNYQTIGFLIFYSELNFFKKTFSLDTPEEWKECFEIQAYNMVDKLGLTDQLYLHSQSSYDSFLGHPIKDYSHQGGTVFEEYNFE